MSKLNFLENGKSAYPRITKKLHLKKYDPSFKADFLEIWLNWSRDFNEAMLEGNEEVDKISKMPKETQEQRDAIDKAWEEWLPGSFERYAEYWGCTPEQARQIYELDIELWNWIREKSNDLRYEFQERRKN